MSLLWRMSAEGTLRTTGKPRPAAASAPSRGVCARRAVNRPKPRCMQDRPWFEWLPELLRCVLPGSSRLAEDRRSTCASNTTMPVQSLGRNRIRKAAPRCARARQEDALFAVWGKHVPGSTSTPSRASSPTCLPHPPLEWRLGSSRPQAFPPPRSFRQLHSPFPARSWPASRPHRRGRRGVAHTRQPPRIPTRFT